VSLRDVPHPDHDTEEFGRRGFLGSAVGTAGGAALLGGLTAGPASAASRATADHPVRTRSGLVTGVPAALDGITVYKHIPYAASTAGAELLARVAARAVLEGRTRGRHLGCRLPSAGHRHRSRQGAATERGLPEPQRLDGRSRFG
jgi:hypothetical protein